MMTRATALIATLALAASVHAAQLGPRVLPRVEVSEASTPIAGGSSLWLPLGSTAVYGTSTEAETVVGKAIALHARFKVTLAPGSTETVVMTLHKGTCGAISSTALTGTILGSATEDEDLTDRVAIAPGECAAWNVTYSASAATSVPRVYVELH